MPGFYETVTNSVESYRNIILAVVMAVVFGSAAYFLYTRYLVNYINNKKYTDVANSESRNEGLEIYFFSADWCPHCKKAKPDWNAFQSQVDGTTLNGYTVNTISVDCTNLDTDQNSAKLVQQYDIKGFPTVVAIKDGKRVDYDAKVDQDSLNKFLSAVSEKNG